MGPLSLDILMNSLLYSLQLSRYSIKFPPVFEFLHADMKDATILSLESPMAFQWLDCFLGFFFLFIFPTIRYHLWHDLNLAPSNALNAAVVPQRDLIMQKVKNKQESMP